MVIVPIDAIASQKFTCAVAGQPCSFWIRQLSTGLYLDLYLGALPVALGVLCQTNTAVILDPTSPIKGDFVWRDLIGNDDPHCAELGTRFVLEYTP